MTFSLDPDAPNIFPAKYRQVSVSEDAPALDLASLTGHFVGRDAYMRTRFIVARCGSETALIEVATQDSDELFRPIEAVRVLAEPSECVDIAAPTLDVGVASQFADLTAEHPGARCLVVEGRYSHVSFLLNPDPLWIDLIDIVPPEPSKLGDQARRVLDIAEDLPPVGLRCSEVSSLGLMGPAPTDVLLPCRVTGVELADSNISHLDQRPPKRNWTLLGCVRSQQIHEAFYGDIPPTVDTCPRQFLTGDVDEATLTRCCLLQQGREAEGRTVLVPWGASLGEVRGAIEALIESEGVVWTPI